MPTLVIMAGGMGSRYGGLKQLDSFGMNGEKIIDYTVFDAVKAGFDKVVFIIKEENLEIFKTEIGNKMEKKIKVEYVFQSTDKLPDGIAPIEGRTKPLGTGHAVWCCKDVVKEPFCVVNSDDYYGPNAFKVVADFLNKTEKSDIAHYCMAGFILKNTLTENGTVSRGICNVDQKGLLLDITEHTKIEAVPGGAISHLESGEDINLSENTVVSMNFWGFTPDIFDELDMQLKRFLTSEMENPLKSEFYLPFAVDCSMNEKRCDVTVLETTDKWHGVTYKEDAPVVREALKNLTEKGLYPSPLFD